MFPLFFSIKILFSIPASANSSSYFLTKEEALLNYGYTNKGDSLQISHWSVYGPDTTTIPLNGRHIESTSNLQLINNQIFYQGQQLTFSKDRKLQPSLLDNTQVLYLSDQSRGVGFYTLRALPLKP